MGLCQLSYFLFFLVVFGASFGNGNQKGDDAETACRGPKGEKVATVISKDTSKRKLLHVMPACSRVTTAMREYWIES